MQKHRTLNQSPSRDAFLISGRESTSSLTRPLRRRCRNPLIRSPNSPESSQSSPINAGLVIRFDAIGRWQRLRLVFAICPISLNFKHRTRTPHAAGDMQQRCICSSGPLLRPVLINTVRPGQGSFGPSQGYVSVRLGLMLLTGPICRLKLNGKWGRW
jgi:hypothetical protein